MQFQRVNRTDAEQVFLTVLNTEASSMTTGYAVALTFAAASADGHQAIMPLSGTAATLIGWVGVAAQDIPANTRGRVQCWGYAPSIYLSQYGTSVTINIGNALVPGVEAGGLGSVVPTYLNAGFKYAVAISVAVDLSQVKTKCYTSGVLRCI